MFVLKDIVKNIEIKDFFKFCLINDYDLNMVI